MVWKAVRQPSFTPAFVMGRNLQEELSRGALAPVTGWQCQACMHLMRSTRLQARSGALVTKGPCGISDPAFSKPKPLLTA